MDLVKIGNFIAKKRKEKNLTQDQLGELMGISGKSVSKWERGLNMPDIEKLEKLCNILNVNVIEILNGEEKCAELNNLFNLSFFDILKRYIKNSKRNYVIIFLFLFIFIFLFSLLFTLGNYNQNKVYSITSDNFDYSLNGYLIFNQEQNLIIISDLSYQGNLLGTSDEPQLSNLKILLKYGDDIIASFNEKFNSNENKYLSEILNDFSITVEENKENNSNIITKIKENDSLFLLIEYFDSNNEVNTINIKLNLKEKFSSNRFFY